eukprot:1192807-Prorocentrum_minimum.AAC.1
MGIFKVCCTVREGRKHPKRGVTNVVNIQGRRGGSGGGYIRTSGGPPSEAFHRLLYLAVALRERPQGVPRVCAARVLLGQRCQRPPRLLPPVRQAESHLTGGQWGRTNQTREARVFSRRTNRMHEARVYSNNGPIGRRKGGASPWPLRAAGESCRRSARGPIHKQTHK